MTLPETVADMPIVDWAIERFFGGYGGPDYRDAIVTAIENGRNAVEAVQQIIQWGGMSKPGCPALLWDKHGIDIWPDYRRTGKPVMRITIRRVVEHVTNELAGQQTLF